MDDGPNNETAAAAESTSPRNGRCRLPEAEPRLFATCECERCVTHLKAPLQPRTCLVCGVRTSGTTKACVYEDMATRNMDMSTDMMRAKRICLSRFSHGRNHGRSRRRTRCTPIGWGRLAWLATTSYICGACQVDGRARRSRPMPSDAKVVVGALLRGLRAVT